MPDVRQYVPPWKRVKEPSPTAPEVVQREPITGKPLSMEELLASTESLLSSLQDTGASARVTPPKPTEEVLGRSLKRRLSEMLHTKGIPVEDFDRFTEDEKKGLWQPGEYVEIRKIDGERKAFAAGKPESLYQRTQKYPIAVAETPITVGPLTLSAGEWVGALGITIAGGMATIATLPLVYQSLVRAAATRNINAWSMKTNTPVDPNLRATLADWIARASKPSWLKTPQLVKELFKPSQAGKFVPTPEATAKANQYTQAVIKRWLPEFSKSRTDEVIAGIRAGKFDPDAVAPSIQAIQVGRMELIPAKPTVAPEVTEVLSEIEIITPKITQYDANAQTILKEYASDYGGVQTGMGAKYKNVAAVKQALQETGLTAEQASDAQWLVEKSINDYYAKLRAIPKAEVGEPEAGLQPISMEDQLKLEQARREVAIPEKIPEQEREAYEAKAKLEDLKTILETDPVVQHRVWVGKSKKGKDLYQPLDWFFSIKEQTFPDYFTLKQARLIKPRGNFTVWEQKGRKEYNRVPQDAVLDELADRFGMDVNQLVERITQIRQEKARVKGLEAEVARALEPAPTAPIAGVTPVEVGKPTISPEQPAVVPEVKAPIEPAIKTPQGATEKVNATQEKAKVVPSSVKVDDAEFAHVEKVAPDGPQPPGKPPTIEGMPSPQRPDKPLSEILGNAPQGERPDQTLLRIHEAARATITRQTNIIIQKGSQKLKALGIGATKRGQLVPREKDKAKLLEFYNALHNSSKVASGDIKVPAGFEEVYNELRGLADWDTASRIDFDPKAATIDDWFFRGWKPPEGMYPTSEKGRLGVKPKPLRMPRVDATFEEMIDLGFEPLFWNPYQQWGYRHRMGETYREQMQLIKWLKGMGEDFARPDAGGMMLEGWRVPRIGPAFEGKPFATTSVDGEPVVMYTRRWIVPERIAESLENIYGRRPSLGTMFLGKLKIDPLSVIDALTFIPKRAKLLFSLFQQIDFLTRSGAGAWTGAVDMLMAGKPIEAVKKVIQYPKTAVDVIQANLSPTKRLSLMEQLDDTTPLVSGRKGINLKGISEQGLSTMDVTIFAEDMDKLMSSLPDNTGLWQKVKGIPSSLVDMESAMRRGLFNGVYPAAMITDIKNNIAPMIARQFPKSTDTQINAMIAKIVNIKYSTIPPSQSVFQNAVLRETLRRIFFSVGESEGLLRQAAGAFHGTNASFWRKHWLGVYLFLIVTANIIHWASTKEPLPIDRYSPVAKDNWGPLPFGYNTKFASPTLPFRGRGGSEITLDLVGQMDTAFRVLDPSFFLSSRTSVLIRAIENQRTGTDFYGAPIDDVGPGGVVSRTAQMIQDLFAPIGLGGVLAETGRQYLPGGEQFISEGESRLGMVGLGIQATGINLRAEWTGDFLDRMAEESGMKKADGSPVQSWQDLEPHQKDKLLENKEFIKELAERRETSLERNMPGAAGFAERESLEQKRIARGEFLVTEFENGEFDANTFRDEVTKLKVEIAAKKSQVDEDFQLFEDTQDLPEDPNKRALVEYYELYDRARRQSGTIDWDKLEQLETKLRNGWTPSQEAYVDRNIGLTEWGPKMQEYIDAQETLKDSGYWDILEPNQSKKRLVFRRQNPEIDSILVKWYGYKSVTGKATPTPATTPQKSGVGAYTPPWRR